MGMYVGESKGGAMAEMNVVPLIDILLVLLIIFMVITPLTPKGMDALVPQPNPNQKQEQDLNDKTIVVQVIAEPNPIRPNSRSTTKTSPGKISVPAWKRFLKSAPRKLLSSKAITM